MADFIGGASGQAEAPTGPAGGDLTGTYPNPTIGAGKVTYAKMQDVAGSSVVGRSAATSGVSAAITGAADRLLGTSAAAVVQFMQLALAMIPDDLITLAKLNSAVKSAAQGLESLRQVYTSTPAALGTAAAGNSVQAAAGNHVHSNVFPRANRSTTATTSALAVTDDILRIGTGSGNHTCTLPNVATASGSRFEMQKTTTDTNTITLAPAGADGAKIFFLGNNPSANASLALADSSSVLFPSWTIESDGTNWYVS